MRLICPRCGAQYEVDDSVVPAAGRDVQCSGCGQTWFQPSLQMIMAEEAQREDRREAPEGWEVAAPAAPAPAPEPAVKATPYTAEAATQAAAVATVAAVARTMREAPAANTTVPVAEDPSELGPAPKAGAVPRRPLDETLLAILREEAAREAAARQAEGTALETQEEMNLEPVPPPAKAVPPADKPAAERPAAKPAPTARTVLDFSDLSSDAEEEPADLGTGLTADLTADLTESPDTREPRGARRQRLPDIEEINSSLRASVDRGRDPAALGTPQHRAKAQSGFRRGFSGVILVALLLVGLYIAAPRLAAAVPALAPVLETYVAAANSGRIWLDQALQAVIVQLQAPPPKA